jgi:acyl-CoA synthetase (AMP-forming)/AMP-acid ligase II
VAARDAVADPQELASWVAETLAPYKVPAHWEIRTDPLPRNAAGKVLKNVLQGVARNAFIED